MDLHLEGGKRIGVTQDLSCSVLNCGHADRNILGFNHLMLKQ